MAAYGEPTIKNHIGATHLPQGFPYRDLLTGIIIPVRSSL
jgi:hypothetical protein